MTNSLSYGSPWGQRVYDYLQLTKPRIIVLLLITTAGAMEIAGQGQVNPWLLLVTLVGGALAAGAANTINCIYDCDIDFLMERTRWRPIPAGKITPRQALLFALTLATLSFLLLAAWANLLAATLAMAGIATYVGVYTLWLKRSSPQNIVIGGAAGAIPPLVGWAAVTGSLDWTAWVLFAIIFIWTPPHFWALSLMIEQEYARAGVPMLPVVSGKVTTAWQILFYTVLLIPVSLLLVFPLGVMGELYCWAALVLGLAFVGKAWQLVCQPEERAIAVDVFKYSILYMACLCGAMALDSLPLLHRSVLG
ncbi:MAG: heme o synthase [Pseudanabaenaceae cyanobacterium]